MIHQHQSMFPLPTISVARVPDETPFRPTPASPARALARTAMVTSTAGAPSWPTQTQGFLPHDVRFREESYRQSPVLSTHHPFDNAEFARRSDIALYFRHNTMPRSHADFHSHETLATGRLHHDRDSGPPGHTSGSLHAEIDGRSERRIDQFRASQTKHDSSLRHVRSSQTVRHDQLARIDDRSSRQTYGERNKNVSNNGYLEPAKSSNERIEFDEVYQNGEAESKHTIIKFSNKFYILKYALLQ